LHGVFANPRRITEDTAAISFLQAFSTAGKENHNSQVNLIVKVNCQGCSQHCDRLKGSLLVVEQHWLSNSVGVDQFTVDSHHSQTCLSGPAAKHGKSPLSNISKTQIVGACVDCAANKDL
jgi:hypothetical protein